MDELTIHIQDMVPWWLLFANNIVLVDETRERVNVKLETWQETMEEKGFRLRNAKIGYMEFKFSNTRSIETKAKIGDIELSASETFKYLQKDLGIDRDLSYIQVYDDRNREVHLEFCVSTPEIRCIKDKSNRC